MSRTPPGSYVRETPGDVVSFVSFSRSERQDSLSGLSCGLESRARGRLRSKIGGLGEPPRKRFWVAARAVLAADSREVYANRRTDGGSGSVIAARTVEGL